MSRAGMHNLMVMPAALRLFLWSTAASECKIFLHCFSSASTHRALPAPTRLFGCLSTRCPHTVDKEAFINMHGSHKFILNYTCTAAGCAPLAWECAGQGWPVWPEMVLPPGSNNGGMSEALEQSCVAPSWWYITVYTYTLRFRLSAGINFLLMSSMYRSVFTVTGCPSPCSNQYGTIPPSQPNAHQTVTFSTLSANRYWGSRGWTWTQKCIFCLFSVH